MRIIVDTNIVFSTILNSQSRIGQIILHSDNALKFYSAKYLQTEIQNNLKKIIKITKLTEAEVQELIDIIYTKINFISEEFIPRENLILAENLTKDIDFDDTIFVALALHFNCKLWTGDKVLMEGLKLKGFKNFISTQELIEKLTK